MLPLPSLVSNRAVFLCIIFLLCLCNIHAADGIVETDTGWFRDEDKAADFVPIQLIRPNEGRNSFEVNQLALDKLAGIKDQVSFVVVTGPYHGGKSFLLNVLLNSTLGFTVGTSPEPETKGLWMRVAPKEAVTGADGSVVIFVDTEGFYGEGVTRSYDSKIFALATLLSSHLIYNTLRTLGDTQSVAELADLSKQAHVFNLNNWLKTGMEDETWEENGNLDASLLLKTLDFPPLTWVVQGFDMDLDSDRSPLRYLEKYFQAHARSGDRSLDTLFTKGVGCHALRTPADLNALRETWGDGGLGAHVDLFDQLHPGYRAELAALQQAVLGGLKAKGDLTGVQWASLLPLLVHYVNKDFPLSAERKLRDVLAEVIIDGAFSGGVQYFDARMEASTGANARLWAAASSSNGNTPSAADVDAMVASAFTEKELAKVMDSAETEAVLYCEKRAIGVPEERVFPTCHGELSARVMKLRPQHRAKNDQRVKEVLVLLAEALQASAHAEVGELRLPQPEAEVDKDCHAIIKAKLAEFDAKVGKHRSGDLYGHARSQLEVDVRGKCTQLLAANDAMIAAVVRAGKEAFMRAYNTLVQEKGMIDAKQQQQPRCPGTGAKGGSCRDSSADMDEPLPPKELLALHSAAVTEGQRAYDSTVADQHLSWVKSGHEQYDLYNFQALRWAKERVADLQSLNEARLSAKCQRLVDSLMADFDEQLRAFSPFPDNDEALSAKLAALVQKMTSAFNDATTHFAALGPTGEAQRELLRRMDKQAARTLERNTAVMSALCYTPLKDAYEELDVQDCERTWENVWTAGRIWKPSCWLPWNVPFGFQSIAHASAKRHLDEAQQNLMTGVTLSPATKAKVISAWVERDLMHHVSVVEKNFLLAAVTLACSLFAVRLLFMEVSSMLGARLYKSKNSFERRGQAGEGNTHEPVNAAAHTSNFPPRRSPNGGTMYNRISSGKAAVWTKFRH